MENYEVISVAGEGSYGIVMKCKNKFTKKVVAIKKLIDIKGDRYAKKMAFREIRILRKLQHENLVKLLEVFRREKRFYLVFEYLDRTVLDDIEDNPHGVSEKRTREYMYQLLRGIEYCHGKNVIHRDIKPENLLVSKCGILKLCDFGFARVLNASNGYCTDYIATRWYRAPELLVKDRSYGRPVDIWAVGCVFAELLSGEPLFPGDSDVDQLFQIMKRFGKLCLHHQHLLSILNKQNELKKIGMEDYEANAMNNVHALHILFPTWSTLSSNIVALCLHLDPNKRPSATELLKHEFFDENHFRENFNLPAQLKRKTSPRKSSITIEFESERFGSITSTPRILNNLRKTPSPYKNVTSTNESIKSPNISESNHLRKEQPKTIVDTNHSNPLLNIHKLVPFNVEHSSADKNLGRNSDFLKSPVNIHYPEFMPDFKFDIAVEEKQVSKDSGIEREEIQELPRPHNEKIGSLNQKNKLKKLSKIANADLNLPHLPRVMGIPKMKSRMTAYFIKSPDSS